MSAEDDLLRIAEIAVGLIPGGAPVAGVLVGVQAALPLVMRLVSGESLASIEADPLRVAEPVDLDALKARMLAAAG